MKARARVAICRRAAPPPARGPPLSNRAGTADGQANPFLPGRGQADPAPRHPLAVLEQGDLPARADLQRVRRLRQAALRGARQPRAVRGRSRTSRCASRFDKDAKTLTITDNGIGMSPRRRSPTWARSPRAARASSCRRCEGDQKKDAQLIGQFGVGFYSRLHRRRPDHRRVAPRRPAGRRGRALELAKAPATSRSRRSTRPERGTERDPAPARRRGGVPLGLEAEVDHPQVLRPHLAADPDAEGGVGRRGEEAGHEGRVGAGQQGGGAVDAAEERDHRRSSTRSSTSRSATTPRRRWPTRTTASRAAASTRSCSTSRRRRRSTCGTATSAAASSSTSSASSSWTTPRR